MNENQNNGQTTTAELPKSDHDYRISNGDKVSLIGIDIYSSPDLSQKEYGLYIYDGTASRPLGNERYQNLAEALQAERGQIKSEIERGAKVERKEREGAPKTENQTPITRTQKDKPEHSADKPHHQSKDTKQSDRPDNKAPEQEGKKVEDTKPNPEKRQDTRGDSQKPQSENENGINWGTVAESAGSTILEGAGIAAAGAGLVALGAVSAPFLLGAGLAFSIGMGINTFFSRANEAMDSGEEDYFGRAAAAGFSDMVPLVDVVGIGEAATGFNYMTGQEMTQQERSEKLGGVMGGAAMDFAPIAGVLTPKTKKTQQKDFVNDVSKEFKKSFKEADGKDKMTKSINAHKATQNKIEKKYGKDQITNEPELGITHFGLDPNGKVRFNMGAKGDIANTKLNVLVELKSYVKLNERGQIEVNKKVGKEWMTTYTNQIFSLELNAKINRDQLTVVITSNGDKIKYNPNKDRWTKMK